MIDCKLNCSAENMTITIEEYCRFADNLKEYYDEDILKNEIERIISLLKKRSIIVTFSGIEIGELTLQDSYNLLADNEEHNRRSEIVWENFLTKMKVFK